jgi:hypothetical protein
VAVALVCAEAAQAKHKTTPTAAVIFRRRFIGATRGQFNQELRNANFMLSLKAFGFARISFAFLDFGET